MIRYVLMDVEGTTTSIAFVHDLLFPYARRRLAAFIAQRENNPEVSACLGEVRSIADAEGDDRPVATVLDGWITQDRKQTALKTLQGMIWRDGYENGALSGHVYDDVRPSFEAWSARGIRLGIYSSGSVEAQKLLFRYSTAGDLSPFLSHYFDTRVGAKRAPDSYRAIAACTSEPAPNLLFLSDVTAELEAAQDAGLRCMQLVRPGTTPAEAFPHAADFIEVSARMKGDLPKSPS